MTTEVIRQVREWADRLYVAERQRDPVPPLAETWPDVPVEVAYRVQLYNVERKLAAGDAVVGHKVGLTSKPMQVMLGVGEPDFGHLVASMRFFSGDVVDYPLIQPKVERELAFVLKADLAGPGVSVDDVISATDYVLPAIEIIDSRIVDWKIRLADTVADNASSGCFVLGDVSTDPRTVNLGTVGGVMRLNGEVVQTGAGAAVLGHPARAIAWLANKLGELGTTLQKGSVVLSGAISAAVAVSPGDDVSVSFGRLGTVEARLQG